MTNKERIINTVLGEKTDRPPFFVWFSMKPWKETLCRWLIEGLEKAEDWNRVLGFDEGVLEIKRDLLGFYPAFEEETLEDNGDKLIVRDKFGVIKEVGKHYSSIPKHLEYPVKNMDDWEKLKEERLNPDLPGRFSGNWDELCKQYNESKQLLQIGEYPYGLFGICRELMGIEEFMVSFYTQPELIKDMMDYMTDFWIRIYEKVLEKVKIDQIHMWEDMSGCQGSLISPTLVREYMLPNYKKIGKFTKEHGIKIFSVDTDGKVDELIPIFLEAGMNLMWPFEVAAGSDIVKFGRQYPGLCILGGIDKRALGNGKEAIDRELERIAPMFGRGRYIPALDHAIPPEVSWEDFQYYVGKLRSYIFKSN